MNNPPKKLLFDLNLYIIFSITLIAVLGVTSIAPALPVIAEKLNITAKSAAMLITVFTLPGIILTPVMGMLSDRIGRKTVLIPSLLLFGTAGTACAFTDSFSYLLVLRFFQGCGAASIGSLNMTLIGDIYEGRERIRAMGYNGTVLSMATGLYPLIGGAVAMAGWNYPFYLALLAFPSGAFVMIFLKNPEPGTGQNFFSYLKKSLMLLNHGNLPVLLLSSLATFILLYGVLIAYLPFFMKTRFNASPLLIGALISSASIATAAAALNLGRLSERFGRKNLLLAAFTFYAVSILSTLFITDIIFMLIPTLIYGFANGLNIPNVHSQIAELAPIEYRGAVMSFNGMILRTGQTLGPMFGTSLFAFGGMEGIFFASSAFALLMALLLAIKLRPQ